MTPDPAIEVPAWRRPLTILRGLLVLHWVLVVLSIIGQFTLDGLLPAELRKYKADVANEEVGKWAAMQILAYPGTIALSLGATAGLWFYQRWACWVFLACEILMLCPSAFTGPSVSPEPVELLGGAATFAAGLIVALSFCHIPPRPPALP